MAESPYNTAKKVHCSCGAVRTVDMEPPQLLMMCTETILPMKIIKRRGNQIVSTKRGIGRPSLL